MTRSSPPIDLLSSSLPEITTKSARASPSCTRNSPAARWMSAEVLARRLSSARRQRGEQRDRGQVFGGQHGRQVRLVGMSDSAGRGGEGNGISCRTVRAIMLRCQPTPLPAVGVLARSGAQSVGRKVLHGRAAAPCRRDRRDKPHSSRGSPPGWCLLSCLISAGNAVSRYLFSLSSNAWLEIQWQMFAGIFLLGAAHVLKLNEHVRVDLLYGGASPRRKLWIDVIGIPLFLIPSMLVMAWFAWSFFLTSFQSGEYSSNAGGLPLWPVKLLLPVGPRAAAASGRGRADQAHRSAPRASRGTGRRVREAAAVTRAAAGSAA